jgi:hypothetical protein
MADVWFEQRGCSGVRPPRHGGAAGTAAIEFALAIPIVLALLAGLIEVGYLVYEAMQVANAAEAGVHYVAKHGFDQPGIAAAVGNASGVPGIVASPAPVQFCGCPGTSGILETACGATCADGSLAGEYVRVSASLVHETILPYPGVPRPLTLTAQAVFRLN